MSDWMAEQLRA